MAKQRLSTSERQAALFGKPAQPAPVMTVPPPNTLPSESAATVESDAPDFEKFLKLPEDNAPKLPRAPRYYGFRTRSSDRGAWVKAPGRWPTIQQAANFAKEAQGMDKRLQIQLFCQE